MFVFFLRERLPNANPTQIATSSASSSQPDFGGGHSFIREGGRVLPGNNTVFPGNKRVPLFLHPAPRPHLAGSLPLFLVASTDRYLDAEKLRKVASLRVPQTVCPAVLAVIIGAGRNSCWIFMLFMDVVLTLGSGFVPGSVGGATVCHLLP